jgi:hypothetical protein
MAKRKGRAGSLAPMRSGTRVAIIVLFVLIAIAGVFQYLAGRKDVRYPGPGNGTSYPPTLLSPTPRSPSP